MVTQRPRIAILDDDCSVCAAISRLLRVLDMCPEAYTSAIAFLDASRENPPECLILDLQMPGMSGLEVMRYLSRRSIRIPTIVITAHAEFADEATCRSAGAAAFFRKPFDALALKSAILNLLP
jgi:FixJ family two-component response regulator